MAVRGLQCNARQWGAQWQQEARGTSKCGSAKTGEVTRRGPRESFSLSSDAPVTDCSSLFKRHLFKRLSQLCVAFISFWCTALSHLAVPHHFKRKHFSTGSALYSPIKPIIAQMYSFRDLAGLLFIHTFFSMAAWLTSLSRTHTNVWRFSPWLALSEALATQTTLNQI